VKEEINHFKEEGGKKKMKRDEVFRRKKGEWGPFTVQSLVRHMVNRSSQEILVASVQGGEFPQEI